jgi:uncharacterized protein
MYIVEIVAKDSSIQGRGVFANSDISKGEIVWKYVEGHDLTLRQSEYENLTKEKKEYLDKVAYLSKESGFYIYPPDNDPALYTNHNSFNYNLSVVVDTDISTEPFFIANRDIKAGEEITNNYHEFDEAIKTKGIIPDWLK